MAQREIESAWRVAKNEITAKKQDETSRYNSQKAELQQEEERVRQEYSTRNVQLRTRIEELTLSKHALQREGHSAHSLQMDAVLQNIMQTHKMQRQNEDKFETIIRDINRRKGKAREEYEKRMREINIELNEKKNEIWAITP